MPSLAPRKASDGAEPTEREREELIEFAKKTLGRDRDWFVETGTVPSHLELGGGTFGRLRDARSAGFNRKLVGIYRPTPAEAGSARLWHDYCAEHGYCTGDLVGADLDPANGYPPHPLGQHEGVWAVLTWQAVRAALRGEEGERQLDLFGAEVFA